MHFIWKLTIPEMGDRFTRYCLTKEKAVELLTNMAWENDWYNFCCVKNSDYYQEYAFEDPCGKFGLETYASIERCLIFE